MGDWWSASEISKLGELLALELGGRGFSQRGTGEREFSEQ